MKSFFLFVFLICSSLAANDLSSVDIQTSFVKTSKNATLEEVSTKQFFKSQTTNFGFYDGAIWEKVQIQNLSNISKTIYAANFRTTLDYVDVYILQNNSITATYLLGDMRPRENLDRRISNFPVMLSPNERLTIYIKHENIRGIVEANWNFLEESYMQSLTFYDSLFFGFYIGITILIVIQTIILYFAIKKKFMIFYALAALFMSISQLIYNGIIYSLNIIDPQMLSKPEITFYFAMLSVILFHYEFFEIKNENKWLVRYLQFLVIIPICFVLWSLLKENDVGVLLRSSILVQAIITSSLIIIGIKMSIKGVAGGWFYVIGQSITFASSVITFGLAFLGHFSMPLLFNYLMPICTLLNVLFMSFALYARLKKQYVDYLNKTNALYNLTRFDNSGMSMHNIIHQWKVPVSRMMAIITEMQTKSYLNQPIEKDWIAVFPEIKNNVIVMSKIIQEFYKFDIDPKIERFSLAHELDDIKTMLGHKIGNLDARIVFDDDNEDIISSDKFILFNALVIIINNFLDIAEKREIKSPLLEIKLSIKNDRFCIELEDNCKGIDVYPIDSIFEPFKNLSNNASKGLGLYIAKTLITEKLNGDFRVENTKNGAIFKILI